MNIFVCIKQVPDTETKIKVSQGQLDLAGAKYIMNPYDEFALEEALKIKTIIPGSQIYAITLGPKARCQDVLRTALAIGADEGVVVDAPENIDTFVAARGLAQAIQKIGNPAIVYTGKLSIDDNASAVSQMIAEHLKIPHATVISKIDYQGESVVVEREIEGGAKEVIELKRPCLLGANKGLNTPRYASLPGIMKAKKKTLQEFTLQQLDVSPDESKTVAQGFELPPERASARLLSGGPAQQAKELVQLLRQESKVI